MADVSGSLPNFSAADLPDRMTEADVATNRYTEAALERHKREGLDLAVRARWIALSIIAVMLPFLNPDWSVLYYHMLLAIVALIGWFQRRFGRVGKSRMELFLLFLDLAVMTFALVFPNPFDARTWPDPMVYQFENFIYFFVILAGGTLAYSWRTIFAIGTWTATMWMIGALLMWWFGRTDPVLDDAARVAFGHDRALFDVLNPNAVHFDIRIQEVVVFMIVAATLGIGVRRFNRLLLGNAALERERENLSRYFSPNVVDELSRNDEPLKQIRNHNVGVMFVDIIGFTSYAADRHPQEVIETLRQFHGRMEAEVFRHGGTLDKYLGDGLMVTFGTPVAGENDASNALSCARAMLAAVEEMNVARRKIGEPDVEVSIGLHYGPVVLGDIGANRLEFAVIGNTVNIASRLEGLTRSLKVRLIVSDDAKAQVLREDGDVGPALAGLVRQDGARVKGFDRSLTIWTLV